MAKSVGDGQIPGTFFEGLFESDNLIKLGIPGKRLRVVGGQITCTGKDTGTYTFKSGDSPGSDPSVPQYLDTRGNHGTLPDIRAGYYETGVGEDLRMDFGDIHLYGGWLFIEEID